MIDEKTAPPPPSQAWQAKAPEDNRWRKPETALTRFLGGSPGSVIIRLFFLSLIVGALLMWLDIRPIDIFQGFVRLANRIWGLGFDAVREMADYLAAGAVVVVPIWLAFRLLAMRGQR